MPDESLTARLDLLDQHVCDLRDAQPLNFAAYESDKMLRRYTERMLHMAIDACIQIGITLLTQEGLRSPENYHDIFIVLGEHAILPQDIVDCMTAMCEKAAERFHRFLQRSARLFARSDNRRFLLFCNSDSVTSPLLLSAVVILGAVA